MRLGFTGCGTEIKGEALMGCGAEMVQERTMPLEISAEHLRQCEDVVPMGDCSKDAGDEELGIIGKNSTALTGVALKRWH